MIISHGRRYIFVHSPKTGGTSMALALEARAMKDDVLMGDTPKAKNRQKRLKKMSSRGRLWKHSTLADIEGLVSADQVQTYFVFTLVRNPWDRVLSFYIWIKEQPFEHKVKTLAKAGSFSEFLNAPEVQRMFGQAPYASYVSTSDGQMQCDLFLRLEHFEDDKVLLEQHLGFDLGMPRVNATQRDPDYRIYYTDADATLVSEMCAADIRQFGYSF